MLQKAALLDDVVRLASVPDFRLGRLSVLASQGQVTDGERDEKLEPRVLQVLVVLVEAGGATVSRDTLVARCWGGAVVGDDAINRTIGRLRKLASGFPGCFEIETIPRIGFRLVPSSPPAPTSETRNVVGIGAAADDRSGTWPTVTDGTRLAKRPPPLADDWRETEADRAGDPVAATSTAVNRPQTDHVDGPTPPTRRIRPRIRGLAALTVASALAFAWISASERGAVGFGAPQDRVAVLEPLDLDLPKTGNADPFSPALAARVRTTLGDVGIPVVGRSDAEAYRGGDMAAAALRDRAAFVLDGSFRRDGGGLTVWIRVVDPRDNLVVWSREFRRVAAESAFLEEQIATHAAYALRCALRPHRETGSPLTPAAVALFVKACDWIQRFDGAPNELLESSRALTAEAPGFARGWSMLALAMASASWAAPSDQADALRQGARDAAARAQALDPGNAESGLALAALVPPVGHWRARESALRGALAVEPGSADALGQWAAFLLETGRAADAVATFRRAAAADPLSPMARMDLVPALSSVGLTAEAMELREGLYRIWPGSPRVRMHRLLNAAALSAPDEKLRVLDDLARPPAALDPTSMGLWRQLFEAQKAGDASAALAVALRMDELAAAGRFPPAPTAVQLAMAGALDRAFAAARRALETPGVGTFFLFTPSAVALRRDPRFIALADGVGLVGYWTDTGHWPDFCALPDLPYDCRAEAARLPARDGAGEPVDDAP